MTGDNDRSVKGSTSTTTGQPEGRVDSSSSSHSSATDRVDRDGRAGLRGRLEQRNDAVAARRDALWDATKRGFHRFLEDAPRTWRNPAKSRFYRVEKEKIMKHVDPLYWGVGFTVVTFVTFRVSGSRWYGNFLDRYLRRGATAASAKSAPPLATKTISPKPHQPMMGYLESQQMQRSAMMKEVTQLPLDIFLSVMLGLSSVVLLSDATKLQKDFAEMPLVPGKSVLYETMCPDLIEAHREINIQGHEHDDDDDPIFETLRIFVRNCEIRGKYINERRESGETRRPDVIPYPGLRGFTG